MCDSNGANPGQVTMATTAPGTDCASQTVTVYINDGYSTLTYGSSWTGTTELAACRSLALAIAAVSGIDSATCNESTYIINIQPNRGRVQFWNLASSAAACAAVSTVTQGSFQLGSTRLWDTGDGALTMTRMDGITPATVSGFVTANGTTVDFTRAHEVGIFAKTTGAVKTAANAQQDFFYVHPNNGSTDYYFELAQGVGALGADTLLASNGLTASATGWLLTLDNTATDSLEITEGIVAGSAHSFLVGTDSAKCQAVFYIPTRANITHLGFGLRKMVAYETASTAAEWLAAYDDKAMIGVIAAGAMRTYTSVGGADTSTTLAHAAAANADLLALEVDMTVGRAVTYKIGTSTPAGTTYAQFQTALNAALAALAADASAVAYSFTNALTVVPSIIIGASGTGTPDTTLVYYSCTPLSGVTAASTTSYR
jgi:hypothetical protein